MPGMLDINLNDAQELKILPDNEEVRLRITRADITPNRSDPTKNNLALTFDVPGEPMVDDIRVWLPIPDAALQADDPKGYTKKVNRIAEFCNAFSLTMPFETEDIIGAEGWAILREDEGLDGSPQNSVRRFIAGK